MNLTPIFDKDKLKRPFLIAGPCSAESHQQVLQTAQELHATKQIDLFRCGIWKPRSSPNSFEGIGESGLPWLKEIKEQLHLDSCIEIGKPEHLEIALKYDITHFWIGARTSVNPFMVVYGKIHPRSHDRARKMHGLYDVPPPLSHGSHPHQEQQGGDQRRPVYRLRRMYPRVRLSCQGGRDRSAVLHQRLQV